MFFDEKFISNSDESSW